MTINYKVKTTDGNIRERQLRVPEYEVFDAGEEAWRPIIEKLLRKLERREVCDVTLQLDLWEDKQR